MASIGKIIVRIVSAICTLSIAKGVLHWLAGKEIYPDRWVNNVIGLAEGAVTANPAGTWILLGFAGLLGLFVGPIIYDYIKGWRETVAKRFPAVITDSKTGKKRKKSEDKEISDSSGRPNVGLMISGDKTSHNIISGIEVEGTDVAIQIEKGATDNIVRDAKIKGPRTDKKDGER